MSALEQDTTLAIAALTDAANRTYQAPDGTQRRYDFGEILCHVVTAAAANLGSVDALLAGRPGSWEADHVRAIVTSTTGDDDEALARYRTVPIRVSLDVEGILYDLTDGRWEVAWETRRLRADEAVDAAYTAARTAHAGQPQIVPEEALRKVENLLGQAAPPTSEQREVWDAIRAEREYLVSVSPELAAAEAAAGAIGDAQAAAEQSYRTALLEAMNAEARRRGYTVPVIDESTVDDAGWDEVAYELEEIARATVPVPDLPGAGNETASS